MIIVRLWNLCNCRISNVTRNPRYPPRHGARWSWSVADSATACINSDNRQSLLSLAYRLRILLQTILTFRKAMLCAFFFSKPQPRLRKRSQVAAKDGVMVQTVLDMVWKARQRGLRTPVLLMGYYNPVLSYGEEKRLKHCWVAGINGFIVVDRPPEEAITMRGLRTDYAYVSLSLQVILATILFLTEPLIAPATSEQRIAFSCSLTDSFISIVSRIDLEGATGTISSGLSH